MAAAIGAARGAITYGIHEEVFTNLPGAKVAVALVEIIVQKSPKAKAEQNWLSGHKQQTIARFIDRYPNPNDVMISRVMTAWRELFVTFLAGPDKRCTLEPLFERVAREAQKVIDSQGQAKPAKANLGKISNIVDLVNCTSIDHEVPIGVMDFANLHERLTLRYGQEGERFTAMGDPTEHIVDPHHLVLADEQGILSWLWTYRVGERVCLKPQETPAQALICVDQVDADASDPEQALDDFLTHLPQIGGRGVKIGVLSRENPTLSIDPARLA
ncbi:MAG: hypothetical protein S4CHLAM102_12470 [Chlamydiia bacterium]|nr:hypothetical protein [Chlamydiia bacterium]